MTVACKRGEQRGQFGGVPSCANPAQKIERPMGPIETRIREKLATAFAPEHIELENESHTHSVPKNSETHFKLVLVSKVFEGLSRVARQRKVYDVLKDELAPGRVHALTQKVFALSEWTLDAASSFESPACMGGSKQRAPKPLT